MTANKRTSTSTGRITVTLKRDTYDQLVKYGDLSDSFDSTISRLVKSAKMEPKDDNDNK